MKTLLLCGLDATPEMVDRQIESLLPLDTKIIAVLGADSAEEIVRRSLAIHDTDLVFDPAKKPDLISQIRAGARSLRAEPAFVQAAKAECPAPSIWKFLAREYARAGALTEHGLLTLGSVEAPCQFPFLLSPAGLSWISSLKDLTSLADARLKVLELAFSEDAGLASGEKPL